MARISIPVEQVLTLLTEMPLRITTLTSDLLPAQLHMAPEPDEWSANDLLAHLRSCADVWGDCIRVILAQKTPTLKAVNPTTWIKQTNYLEQEFQPSLQAFIAQRTDLLAVLEPLGPEEWERSVTVTGAGKALERTVFFYAQWLARHERTHIKQLTNIVKTVRL